MTEPVPAPSDPTLARLRVAAYVVCVRAGQLLLARFIGRGEPHWTLPGGGLNHAEHPYDAAVREVEEETGYLVRIDRLLGVGSQRRRLRGEAFDTDLHTVQFFYSGTIGGGALRHEADGSTDQAAWFDLARVGELPRAAFVDVALAYLDALPADGLIPAGRDIVAAPDNIARPSNVARPATGAA